MTVLKKITMVLPALFLALSCNAQSQEDFENKGQNNKIEVTVNKTSAQWKEELSMQEYEILRQKGTEKPFKNAFWDSKKEGMYICAACQNVLFSSETKFKSGTGWPSFYTYATDTSIATQPNKSGMTTHTEVICAKCGGHLGHVFKDGPQPTGLRYCMNSAAMDFRKE